MTEDYFLRMALNNAWANATLYTAMKGLSADKFWAKAPGFFGALGATMNHIYEVDLYYLDALSAGGKGRAVYQREDIRDPAQLGAAQSDVDMALAMFCKGLTPEALTKPCQTERKHAVTSERTDWLLLHLFQHQIHHRGQAHVMLGEVGIAPPQLDDFYLEFGRVPSAAAYWS